MSGELPPGRGLIFAEAATPEEGGGIIFGCDCGHTTQVVIEGNTAGRPGNRVRLRRLRKRALANVQGPVVTRLAAGGRAAQPGLATEVLDVMDAPLYSDNELRAAVARERERVYPEAWREALRSFATELEDLGCDGTVIALAREKAEAPRSNL